MKTRIYAAPAVNGLTDQITVIGKEMSAKNLRGIFTHLELWVAVARHKFKWVKI